MWSSSHCHSRSRWQCIRVIRNVCCLTLLTIADVHHILSFFIMSVPSYKKMNWNHFGSSYSVTRRIRHILHWVTSNMNSSYQKSLGLSAIMKNTWENIHMLCKTNGCLGEQEQFFSTTESVIWKTAAWTTCVSVARWKVTKYGVHSVVPNCVRLRTACFNDPCIH